jgi:hypothetical protein
VTAVADIYNRPGHLQSNAKYQWWHWSRKFNLLLNRSNQGTINGIALSMAYSQRSSWLNQWRFWLVIERLLFRIFTRTHCNLTQQNLRSSQRRL